MGKDLVAVPPRIPAIRPVTSPVASATTPLARMRARAGIAKRHLDTRTRWNNIAIAASVDRTLAVHQSVVPNPLNRNDTYEEQCTRWRLLCKQSQHVYLRLQYLLDIIPQRMRRDATSSTIDEVAAIIERVRNYLIWDAVEDMRLADLILSEYEYTPGVLGLFGLTVADEWKPTMHPQVMELRGRVVDLIEMLQTIERELLSMKAADRLGFDLTGRESMDNAASYFRAYADVLVQQAEAVPPPPPTPRKWTRRRH